MNSSVSQSIFSKKNVHIKLVLLLNSKYFDNSTPITRSSRTFVPVVIEDAFDGDVHLLLDLDLVHLLEV